MKIVALVVVLGLAALLAFGCGTAPKGFDDPPGETTTLEPETTTSTTESEATSTSVADSTTTTETPPFSTTLASVPPAPPDSIPRLQTKSTVVFSTGWRGTQKPAAFWATPEDELFILDSAGRRVLVIGKDGDVDSRVAIDMEYPRDVAVADDGTILVVGAESATDGSEQIEVVQSYGADGGMIDERRGGKADTWMQQFVADDTAVYCTAVEQTTLDVMTGDYRYVTRYPAAYRGGELLDPWAGWDKAAYGQPLAGGLALRVGDGDPGEPVGSKRGGEIHVYSGDDLVFSASLPMPDYGTYPTGMMGASGQLLLTNGWMLAERLPTCLADDVWVYSPAGQVLGKLNVLHPMSDQPDGGVSRSRLTPTALFQLGTTSTGIQVVRHDLTTLAEIPPLPEEMPADFSLVAAYGQGWRMGNSIDTASGRCTKDLLDGGVVKTTLRLTDDELREVYSGLVELGITQYDAHFVPEAGGSKPEGAYENYWLQLRLNDETTKFLFWADNLGSETREAVALRDWFAGLWRIIEGKPAWQALPPAQPE